MLRLDGEPSSGCDSSVSVLEGAVVVGGISVATPSAVVRMSLTVSLLMDKRLFDTNAVTNPHMFGKSFEYTAKKQSSSSTVVCCVCESRDVVYP